MSILQFQQSQKQENAEQVLQQRILYHEMKNNLNLLKFGITELREDQSDPVQTLNVLETVFDLFEALQTNSKSTHFRPIIFNDIILQQLSILEPLAAKQKIDIKFKFLNPDIEILGDSDQLARAFFNLIVNAMEACGGGDSISVETWTSSLNAHLTISDTGNGMSVETLDSMWKPFFTTKNDGYKSHGLSTYIARTAILKHNGSITAESHLNEGTTIHISLPLYHSPLAA
ncbi:HAMP domain-containing histidine kinase [bacterium]|nr:HAMP domain-containing histidine kinase [bacterium]